MIKIGVLDIQGDVEKHLQTVKKCQAEAYPIKKIEDLKIVQGLIIPGGESTTIGKFLVNYELDKAIQDLYQSKKLSIFGVCAGAILLAKKIKESNQPTLKLMNIEIERNAYGPQKFSFEDNITIEEIGEKPYPSIFIRAPKIIKTENSSQVLARYEEYAVLVREDNLLACTFHPELTPDIRIHQYFINMVKIT